MTEKKGPVTAKPAKQLLSLNPSEETEFKKKVQAVKKRPNKDKAPRLNPGVIYIGHLHTSLCEPDLQEYFEQFGKITRLRLARSKKTGRSKGYGFVEFDCDEVAKIVAETMNNYLMSERLIKAHVVPPEKVHEKLFVGCRTTFKKPKYPAVTRYNQTRSAKQVDKMNAKLVQKENRLRKRIAEQGIDYDFPGFAAKIPKKKPAEMNSSTCSDVTPVCTPSVLEKRRSMKVDDDEDDHEIIIKATPRIQGAEEEEEEEEEEEVEEEEDGDSEDEEQDEVDARAAESPQGDGGATEEQGVE